ncbi:MAG: winged helix-turn-helix domain-containing protein [Candidatus Heimdallarchaeota archaeon]
MNENSFDDEFIVELNSYLESIYILGHKKHLNDLKNDLMKLNKKDETDLNEVIHLIEMSISSNSMEGVLEGLVTYVNKEDNYGKETYKIIKQFIEFIRKQNYNSKNRMILTDFSNVDPVIAYKQIIEPLSNQKRIEILIAIKKGKKRFRELETSLNLQAGHLIYHLNPLKEAKYIFQDEKKNYLLSEKAYAILGTIEDLLIKK